MRVVNRYTFVRVHILTRRLQNEMTFFAFFQNDPWREKPPCIAGLEQYQRTLCCTQLYSGGRAVLVFMKSKHQYFRCSLHVLRLTLLRSIYFAFILTAALASNNKKATRGAPPTLAPRTAVITEDV